jgi:hypothetical protein
MSLSLFLILYQSGIISIGGMESSGEIEHSEMRDFVERMHGRLIYWTDDGEQLLTRLCCMDEFLFANSYGQIIQFTWRLISSENSFEHSIQCALIVKSIIPLLIKRETLFVPL